VRVPLRRHGGAPAVPQVQSGEWVKKGDVIAASPAGSLGAVCHASIAGRVVQANGDWLEISKG
jgi:Na+-translocating ferredoxin:NAD+ oxidoreductase RnfC subunit